MAGSECYLIDNGSSAALVDSGFAFCAHQMIENVKRELGARPLDYIFLTHTHYDHASGSAYCRSEWPGVRCVGSAYAAKILAKESAVAVMRDMNSSAAALYGYAEYPDELDKLGIDIVVADGDTIDLGGMEVRVVEAPGHTRCSVAFYVPSERTLLSCETIGICGEGDYVVPCYLVGYDVTLQSIRKVQALDVEQMLVPHTGMISGEPCATFLRNALICAQSYKDEVVACHASGMTIEQITQHCKDRYYVGKVRDIQPEKAYDLNAKYMIPMLIGECCK